MISFDTRFNRCQSQFCNTIAAPGRRYGCVCLQFVPTASSILTTVTDHLFLFINTPQASTRNTFFCWCSDKGEFDKVRERCFPKRDMEFLKIGFRRNLYLFNSRLVKVQTLCRPRNLKALRFKLNIITISVLFFSSLLSCEI